jgi:hypothetical protein
MNKERLLNVAKALRESEKPHEFDMGDYVNDCGTPACALGHYAFRTDLQTLCVIKNRGDGSFLIEYREHDDERGYDRLDFDDGSVLEHFGISIEEAEDLFSSNGCGEAQTPNEAAEYIERFVATAAE